MIGREGVVAFLEAHGISYTLHEHPPFMTFADVEKHTHRVPGRGSKNLFLRNRAGTRYFLFTLCGEKRADLAAFANRVGEKKVLFGNEDEMMRLLGLTPGSVSLAGLLNDSERKIEVYLDEELARSESVHVHPNVNTASLTLSRENFARFLALLPHTVHQIPA